MGREEVALGPYLAALLPELAELAADLCELEVGVLLLDLLAVVSTEEEVRADGLLGRVGVLLLLLRTHKATTHALSAVSLWPSPVAAS